MPENNAPKIAVILNPNARALNNQETINLIRENLPSGIKLYVSETLAKLDAHAKRIIEGGYDVVYLGGGDSTFARGVTSFLSLEPENPPTFGFLPFGTGNGIASALECGEITANWLVGVSGLAEELAQAANPKARAKQKLLKVNDIYTPFVGLGLDGLVLDDYNWVKKNFDKLMPLFKKERSVLDYGVAVIGFSLWRYATSSPPWVKIRNGRRPSFAITKEGKKKEKIAAGDIVYEGPASFIGASTIPYYGFGIPIFPQANMAIMQGRFQLRIAHMTAGEIFANSIDLLMGKLHHPKIHDYACEIIDIEVMDLPKNKKYAGGLPLQISGDYIGLCKKLHIELASKDIEVILGSGADIPSEQ